VGRGGQGEGGGGERQVRKWRGVGEIPSLDRRGSGEAGVRQQGREESEIVVVRRVTDKEKQVWEQGGLMSQLRER